MSSVATGLTHCLNCGSPLGGTFCAECGQKAAPPDPTFHDFLHELTHELLHVDGRLLQSIRLLFFRPGFLTREHFEGRRVSYAAPMRLYLTFSLIFFVLAVYAPLEMTSRMDAKRGRILHTGGLDISGDVLEGRTDVEVAEWVRKIQHEWMPRVMFVMVPVFALLTARSTKRQRRHFPQHLYFALHNHAAWFGMIAVAEAIGFARNPLMSRVAWLAAGAAIVVYTTVAVRRVYERSWLRSAWQTGWTMFGYAALLIVSSVFMFIGLYFVDKPK
jgi:hypothetical protein